MVLNKLNILFSIIISLLSSKTSLIKKYFKRDSESSLILLKNIL